MEAIADTLNNNIMIDSKDVIIREDLYPRFKKDIQLIEKYAESGIPTCNSDKPRFHLNRRVPSS